MHTLAVVENYQTPMHGCMVMGATERGNGLFVVSCWLDQRRAGQSCGEAWKSKGAGCHYTRGQTPPFSFCSVSLSVCWRATLQVVSVLDTHSAQELHLTSDHTSEKAKMFKKKSWKSSKRGRAVASKNIWHCSVLDITKVLNSHLTGVSFFLFMQIIFAGIVFVPDSSPRPQGSAHVL